MASLAGPLPPPGTRARAWPIVPCAVAGLFVCAALAALVVPGARLRLGPIRVSFGDASRLWFQAALAALVAVAAAPGGLGRPARG